MNEHSFVRSIHRQLPPELYRWKIADRFQAGVADAWYSGMKGDVWVEYKYLPRTPVRKFKVPVTALQRHWLESRETEGRNVAVILGCPAGAAILKPTDWNTDGKVEISTWSNKKEVVAWLIKQTMH